MWPTLLMSSLTTVLSRSSAGGRVAVWLILTASLTFVGDSEGAPTTNDWRNCSAAKCKQRAEVDRKKAAEKRGDVGRKKKSPLREAEIPPFRGSELRKAS